MNLKDIEKLVTIDVENDAKFLHLTPNENVLSESAKKFLGSTISTRYNFGPAYNNEAFTLYAGFTSLAKKGVHELVGQTESAINERLGSSHVLFAPLSGLHAMMMAVLSTTQPGDTVYCLDQEYGGHFATMGMCQSTGRHVKTIPFNKTTLDVDYAALQSATAQETNNYIVYIDASYSLIPFDLTRIKQIIGSNILIYDASHTFGLILGGAFPNPLNEGADIISANTHKTLPGSHKGILVFGDSTLFAEVDQRAHVFYSSTHTDHLIALCVTIHEMLHYGTDYAHAVVRNANLLGDLLQANGLACRRADSKQWSHTHQLHLPTGNLGNVESLAKCLFDSNIAVSFDNMFEQGPFIRFGLQEVTRRGITEKQLESLAKAIADCLKSNKNVGELIESILTSLNKVGYSFDAA